MNKVMNCRHCGEPCASLDDMDEEALMERNKRPSARAEPLPPKVSLEDLARAFEADGGKVTDAEQELLARATAETEQ